MSQVASIDSGLAALLGSKQSEVARNAATHDYIVDDCVPRDVKEEAIGCRYEDIARMADELEKMQSLNIPPIEFRRRNEEQMHRINKLSKEFDELTLRSVQLTKLLMEQVNKENFKTLEKC